MKDIKKKMTVNKKIQMEKRLPWGVQSDIARKLKVSHVAVSLVFRGMSRSARIEGEIARRLGKTRDEWLRERDRERKEGVLV